MIVNKNSQPEEIDELEIIESIEKVNQIEFKMDTIERKIDEFNKTVDGFTTSTNDAVNIFKQSDTLTNHEVSKIRNVTDVLEESVQKLESDYCNLKYLTLFAGILGVVFMIISFILIFYIMTHS
mgnify:FL=1